MIRLVPNHAAQIKRSEEVSFTFDGETVQGRVGESVAAALLRAGHLNLRAAPQDGAARGAFCLMGLCQECAVRIDGQVVEACRSAVEQDLKVDRAE